MLLSINAWFDLLAPHTIAFDHQDDLYLGDPSSLTMEASIGDIQR